MQRQRRTVDILVPQDQAARLDGIALDTQGPLSIPCRESLSIGGVELDVGNVWLELPDARLVGRTQVERDGADMERLEFVGDLYSYRFERWLASAVADQQGGSQARATLELHRDALEIGGNLSLVARAPDGLEEIAWQPGAGAAAA